MYEAPISHILNGLVAATAASNPTESTQPVTGENELPDDTDGV